MSAQPHSCSRRSFIHTLEFYYEVGALERARIVAGRVADHQRKARFAGRAQLISREELRNLQCQTDHLRFCVDKLKHFDGFEAGQIALNSLTKQVVHSLVPSMREGRWHSDLRWAPMRSPPSQLQLTSLCSKAHQCAKSIAILATQW